MKKILIPLFLLGTAFMMYIMAQTSALLKTPATKMGIINLELASDTAKTNAIINAWAPNAVSNKIEVAKINTYWDLLFLFFYAGLLYLLCNFIAANTVGIISKAGYLIANAAILAGIADVMENTGMLFSLNGLISPIVSFCTAFFSAVKWLLVFIAILYVLIGLLFIAWKKIKSYSISI
jgi:hypothetical protein